MAAHDHDVPPGQSEVPRGLTERLNALRRAGFGVLEHDSHVPFLSHLLGTRRVLANWGERPAMCDAGLFHSVYGTEYFTPTSTPSRAEVAALVGEEAEELAHLWCVIERRSIGGDAPFEVRLRHDGSVHALSAQTVADLVTLWAADTEEQIARMTADERGFADGLRAVLHLARPQAQVVLRLLGGSSSHSQSAAG